MEIPSICRYCGGKIIKSTTRALYPKGREPVYYKHHPAHETQIHLVFRLLL